MNRMYRRGGTSKNDWISAKISKLEHENKGRSHEQNIAIAYSMWNQKHEDGGQQQIEDYSSEAPFLGNNPWTGGPNDFTSPTQIPPQILAHDQQIIPQFDLGGQGVLLPPAQEPFNMMKGMYGFDPNTKRLVENPTLQPKMPAQTPMTSLGITADKLPQITKPTIDNNTAQVSKTGKELYQFDNTYGEIDFGQSMQGLGQSIKSGDTAGAALFGVNALAKGTKSFLQGYGSENRKQNILQGFSDRFRRSMTGENRPQFMKEGGYYQEGGQEAQMEGETPQFESQEQSQEAQMLPQIAQALQQGTAPEQLVAYLVQNGVEQEDATEMVQQAMQQPPQFKCGGKMYEEGGQEQQMQEIAGQVAQALQQGADPNQVLQSLVQAGVPQEMAQQVIQAVMQQMQAQAPAPQQQAPMQEEQPPAEFKDGGEVLKFLANKTIKGHTYNPKTDSYEIIYG